ncbi:glycosyltransferase family 2 protein [Pseudokineococcus sp. 1T1Z-3]|uniref:glycosyltransferase family 2 protein n=1 Tax=Pseudokineococcus sp. 1T1Z-3 TaxID=3132745 RepID=UPI0030ACBFF2
MPSVAVVVPVRSGGPAFERCLTAVDRLDPAPDRVLVVLDGTDAGADPGDRERAVRHGAQVLALPERGGPGRARNEGVRRLREDVVLLVDADVEPAPDAVGVVASHLEQNPHVAAVFGAYDDTPAEPGFLSQYKNLLNHLMHDRERVASTFWAGCGAVRRADLAAVGGFDERYERPEVEDVELGGRLVAAGRTIHLLPHLRATHLKRWTARGLLRTDVLARALPWSELILRTGSLPGELDVSPRHRVQVALVPLSLLAVLAAAATRGRRRPLLALSATGLGAVVALDAPLLAGFARLRGPVFAARTAPWRVAAYGASALGLALAAVRVGAERAGLRAAPEPRLRRDLDDLVDDLHAPADVDPAGPAGLADRGRQP